MDQNIFFSQQDADHVAGDRARTLMSRMETRASSPIIFFIFVDYHKQRVSSVYKDTKVHQVNKSLACKVFHRLASHSACQLSIFDQRRSDVANSEDKVYS